MYKSVISLLFLIILVTSSVSGDTFDIKTTNDNLAIEESFGDVISSITSTELPILTGISVSTNQGSTSSEQFIRFGGATSALSPPKVKYTRSEDDTVDSYIYIESGSSATSAFFEYELYFDEGLESEISSAGKLEDLDDIKIKIFGDEYYIIDSDVTTSSSKISLSLSSGAMSDSIKTGEEKEYTVDNKKYKIVIDSITSSPKTAIIKVDGEEIGNIGEGGSKEIDEGVILGVRRIINSIGEVPDVIVIYIGSNIIDLEDHYNDETFEAGYSINKDKISEGFISIKATVSNDLMSISSIKYRANTNDNIYIPKNKRLSEKIEDPKVLWGNWDLSFAGLINVEENEILFEDENDKYDLIFENVDGTKYEFPLIHKNGNLGDSQNFLKIVESTGNEDFSVASGDYFAISSNAGVGRSDKTYIMQYDSISVNSDGTGTLYFKELVAGAPIQKSTTLSSNSDEDIISEGTLTIGSVSSKIYVSNDTAHNLSMDFDGDGLMTGKTIDLVSKGGALIDLGTSNTISFPHTIRIITKNSMIEETTTDEAITFQFISSPDFTISPNSYTNIIMSSSNNNYFGISNYGVLFEHTDNSGNPDKLKIKYPSSQRFADASIEVLQGLTTTLSSSSINHCQDNIQNVDETGVDCGGSCVPCESQSDQQQNNSSQNQTNTSTNQETTAEFEAPEDPCPLGCLFFDTNDKTLCINVGDSIDGMYCSSPGDLITQKRNGEFCSSNLECKTSMCIESRCGKSYSAFAIMMNILLIFWSGSIIYLIYELMNK
jgi:hypothetical protein